MNLSIPRQKIRWAIAALGIGLLAACWQVQRTEQLLYADFLRQGRLLLQAFNPEPISQLRGSAEDEETPLYRKLKAQFLLTRQAFPQYRFLYVLRRTADGRIVFLVDSEPADSPEGFRPGEVVEASPALRQAFSTAQVTTEGPRRDRGGPWKSALLPLFHRHSGENVAVVGIDISLRHWRLLLLQSLLLPALGTISFLLILLLSPLLLGKREPPSNPRRQGESKRYGEAIVICITGLTITVFLTIMVYEREQRSRQAAFAHLAAEKTSSITEALRETHSQQMGRLGHFLEGNVPVDRQEFLEYTERLIAYSEIQSWQWVPAVPVEDRLRWEAAARHDGIVDYALWELDCQGQRVPAARREWYYPVFYVAPREGNHAVLGFDLGSDPLRRRALEQARRTGLITASDPLPPIPENGIPPRINLVRPVFPQGVPKNQGGFVLAVLDMDQLLARTARIAGSDPAVLTVSLYQLGNGTELFRLSSPSPDQDWLPARSATWRPSFQSLSIATPLFAFGKVYLVVSRAGRGFSSLYPLREGWLSALAGTLLTLLLSVFGGFVAHYRLSLEKRVRRRTAELHESQELLQATLRSIGDGVISTDAAGRISGLNAAAEVFTGYTHAEARGKPVDELFHIVHAQTGQALESPVHRALQQARTVTLANHTLLIARDGTRRQIADCCSPICDSDGTILGAVLVFRDVTEEYRRREELRWERRLLRTIIDNIPDGIYAKDRETRKLLANPADVKHMGLDREEEALGKTDFAVFPSDIAEQFYQDDRYVLSSGKPVINREEKAFKGSGQERWLLTSKLPLFDDQGQVIGLAGIGRDVTEQKKAEAALRHSEQEKALILNAILEMISFLTPDLSVQWANWAATEALGLPLENLVGKPCFELWHQRSEPCPACPVVTARDTGRPATGQVSTPDGRTWLLRGYPVLAESGEVTALIEFGQNITEQKRAEERIRHLSFHDSLTDLYNRAFLEAEMQRLDT
ncbi:MAG TPA: PAS domain-containing protein, partial [Atribacteraceae bacterium]|nr:PAS domain-containing protein [Atribacteraceae bacterium]